MENTGVHPPSHTPDTAKELQYPIILKVCQMENCIMYEGQIYKTYLVGRAHPSCWAAIFPATWNVEKDFPAIFYALFPDYRC